MEERVCVYFSFVWFVNVAMCFPRPTQFHTPMARYSLYVLKVLLNTKQTNKQTNSVTPLHRLRIHFLQLWYKIELLPTPFLHTPHDQLSFSSTLSFILQLNITSVFPVFIFKPFASNPDFHFLDLDGRE